MAPRLGCKGIQRIHPLRNVIVLAGTGVGGGSLMYGNTLYQPRSDAFFRDAQWAHITDWRAELAPVYDQAKRMLGVVVNPTLTAVDEVYRTVAEEMGVGHPFTKTPVGVFFGCNGSKEPGVEVDDPFFGGVGPRAPAARRTASASSAAGTTPRTRWSRTTCIWRRRPAPACIRRQQRCASGRCARDGYAVETVRSGPWWTRRGRRTFTAEQVIFAAGTLGTQRLLHRMRSEATLPRISRRLGELTRTNSEALAGAEVKPRHRKNRDFRHRDHVIVSSRRLHAHRARSLRQGLQRDGVPGDRHDRWRRTDPAPAEVAGADLPPSRPVSLPLRRARALV